VAKPKTKPKKRKKPRPDLRDVARRDRFIREYLKDLNGKQAAIRVGFAVGSARQTGSRLLSRDDVRDAVERALSARNARVELTADKVLQQLQCDHDGAAADRQFAPAVRADELLGRHLGMFVTKHQVDVSMSLREMIEAAGNAEVKK
jgi:phage terminase small subunit